MSPEEVERLDVPSVLVLGVHVPAGGPVLAPRHQRGPEPVPPQPVQGAVVEEVLPLELEVVLLLDPGVLLRGPRVLHRDGHDAEGPGQGGQVHVLLSHPDVIESQEIVRMVITFTLFADHSRR